MLSEPFSSYVEQHLNTALGLHKCRSKMPLKCTSGILFKWKCDCAPIKKSIGNALYALKRARAVVKCRNMEGHTSGCVPYTNWFGETASKHGQGSLEADGRLCADTVLNKLKPSSKWTFEDMKNR